MRWRGLMTQEELNQLLSNTEKLFKQIYYFEQIFDIEPKGVIHVGASIAYSDIMPRTNEFLKELRNTVISWVFSQQKAKDLFEKRYRETSDFGNSMAFVDQLAKSKFRSGFPAGQFGELLLFNFIQYFFKAPPLLRKMSITTSTSLERFGVDALHYGTDANENNIFYLGEAKSYKTGFNAALEKALSSIETTFNNFNAELDLYVYDDFITPSLQKIAEDYKNNELKNVCFELVCILVYDEKEFEGKNQEEIEESIKKSIEKKTASFKKDKFSSVKSSVLQKLHYVFFPINNLESILTDFEKL